MSFPGGCSGGYSLHVDGEGLQSAIATGSRDEVTRALSVKGVNINCKDHAFLVKAASAGLVEIVEVLLEAGADPNLFDGYGRTALMEAAYGGHAKVVTTLLRKGNRKDNEIKPNLEEAAPGHRTALMTAALYGHHPVVAALVLDPRVEVNYAESTCNMTALMWAAGSNTSQEATIKALLGSGTALNLQARDSEGRTAYAIACGRGFTALLPLLYFAGCDAGEAAVAERRPGSPTDTPPSRPVINVNPTFGAHATNNVVTGTLTGDITFN